MCELVSGSPKFPASREKTGNLHLLALRGRQMMPNTGADPMSYEEIPYASERGNFLRPNRELSRGIREFSSLIRESPILGRPAGHLP